MKKFLSTFYLFLAIIFCCSYTFPDETPDWKKINSYLPGNLEFQRTTVEEAMNLCPEVEVYDIDHETKIIGTEPEKTNVFKEVNLGFRSGTLDWIEFVLNKKIEMDELITIYGFPRFIDSDYSDEVDYFNYDTFNISTNKEHTLAKSITIFDIDTSAYENAQNNRVASSAKGKFFQVFPGIKPGVTTEQDFIKDFPNLLPYMEDDFDVNSSYTLTEELAEAQYRYKSAVLRFENGLLTWVSLVPVNPELEPLVNSIKASPEIEKLDDDYDFYVYDNFIFVVSTKYRKVSSIGIVKYDERF